MASSLSTRPTRGQPPGETPLKTIGGRRVLRRLGAGAMAEVYLAWDEARNQTIAVKVLPVDLAQNDTYVRRFDREARVGHKVKHPNVVRCFGLGDDKITRQRFLLMEYVKGANAQVVLDRGGPLPYAQATRVLLDIARGLEALHHCGFVHRDVKPGNILIDEEGRAKLADLGVAKPIVDGDDLTQVDQGIGTPYYMSWEQSVQGSLADPRSDLFSLGATFYHLLTGQVPFPGADVQEVGRAKAEGVYPPARSVRPELPKSVDLILSKLLARDIRDRFQTATEAIAAVTAAGLVPDESVALGMDETEKLPEPTRPAVELKRKPRPSGGPEWLYKYQHGSGFKEGKAREKDLAAWYAEGILPDDFFLARPGERTHRHFRTFAEFEKLKRRPKKSPPRPKPSKLKAALLAVGLTIAVTAAASLLLNLLFGG